MIQALRIENFALIDEVHIQFNQGFTVITGETGSGKSILLNALNLILGERANFSVIGSLKDKSIVEAEINIANFGLKPFFDANELDYFDQCIVRREISVQGRSRAFINDTPVQLNTLKEFTGKLIHIHSQYNTLELKEVDFQLEVLDILSGTMKLRNDYHQKYNQLQRLKQELSSKTDALHEMASISDYNAYQLNELLELRLEETDYAKLQESLNSLENVDELQSIYGELSGALTTDSGILDQLSLLKATFAKRTGLSPKVAEFQQRIESVFIELTDLANEAEDELEGIEADPEQVSELSVKLDEYNRVLFKHKSNDQEELLSLMQQLSGEATSAEGLENEVAELKHKIESLNHSLVKAANDLHEKRMKAVPKIEKQIQTSLNDLKLTNTRLIFALEQQENLTRFGNSSLVMLFSPNEGVEPVPVHRAASGGELSRVMLALQSLMSSKTQLRTILFDEIDTGVSGDVAQKVGNTLTKMGEGMQVIAITHLPQVAAKGGQHLKVRKSAKEGRTTSEVVELTDHERVEETARLMSGDQINEAAMENARALMR